MKKIIKALSIIIIGLSLFNACSNNNNKENEVATDPNNGLTYDEYMSKSIEEQNAVFKTIVDDKYYDMYGIYHIEGRIINNKQDVEYLEVTIPIYDYQGNKIGNLYDQCCGLKLGESWKFDITSFQDIGHIGDIELYAY